LTGLSREDSPKTCPNDHKMAERCADGTFHTPKIQLENRIARGGEGL